MSDVVERIEGVVIGLLLGFDAGVPLVVFPGNPEEIAVRARSLAELTAAMVGAEVALLFEGGDASRPLIVGRIIDPARRSSTPTVVRDGERVQITAEERIELRCGKATIIMEKDGHITIRGTYVTSQARAANRILGGSVNLN
ncbi:hypothetical protein B5K05_24645 [Rhizobium phaseoli]|uniref:DUF6484 domain-containing protein n=1 Tax=Rhizobium phaseoli TaxID=396 RepID=UPI000309A339|nr:DUF6484 domain-containing protein [Rhizobium phaseoli]KKZ84307.1 hypothetical protein RPHASCH2410_PD05195 [Rhizobium phaseoli Ch24-10]RDJ04363.1 hypothetical protein B5K04_24575 [Rhizobium phaseoli]RDJ06252.1 hypothetical protein B5K05_24645 [Rhizobium phaseoli]